MILPHRGLIRLDVGKRKGEDTREHASSSQPLSTLPEIYRKSQERAAAGTLGREQIAGRVQAQIEGV